MRSITPSRWPSGTTQQVTVLYVSSPPPLSLAVTSLPGDVPVLPPVQPDLVADDVRQFCGPATTAVSGRAIVVKVNEGNPAKEIVQEAEHTDLLVMGDARTKRLRAPPSWIRHEKVIRTTHVPALTVPPPVERPKSVQVQDDSVPDRILDRVDTALEYALSLAEEADARLILLHVVEGSAEESSLMEIGHLNVREYYRYLEEDAMARLKAAVPEEARVWCKPDERVVTGKAVPEDLGRRRGRGHAADRHGRAWQGALHLRLFGSTTHHIIREAGCPGVSRCAADSQMSTVPIPRHYRCQSAQTERSGRLRCRSDDCSPPPSPVPGVSITRPRLQQDAGWQAAHVLDLRAGTTTAGVPYRMSPSGGDSIPSRVFDTSVLCVTGADVR